MMRVWVKRVAPVVACLFMALPAWAQVSDELNMFSKDARDRAAREIADIKRVHKKDLLIETREAPKLPASINPKDDDAVNRYLNNWAAQQFRNHKTNGVYIVVTKNPNKVLTQVGQETGKYFGPTEEKSLRDAMVKNFMAKKFDDGLSVATTTVRTSFDQNKPKAGVAARPAHNAPAAAAAEGGNGGGISIMTVLLWVGGFLLVFWVIRALIGALAGGGGGQGAPGYAGAGGGGGGFFSSLMGGLFGAAAGMWMYNHFFGHSTPSAWGGTTTPSDPVDTSSSGGASDWGGDNAGNDAGGGAGDWGGGDAGGGDWGGGGDFGGGGGDWGGGGDFGGGGGDW
jgi:uncharacterized protein